MTAKLLCKAAYVPLLVAGLLSGISQGCKKKNNIPSSRNDSTAVTGNQSGTLSAVVGTVQVNFAQLVCVDDTGQHRFQVYGTAIQGKDTSVLAVYFPDTLGAASSIGLDGALSTLQYFNPASAQLYSQYTGNANGSVLFLSNDRIARQVSGNFSGTVYANGFEADSTILIAAGSFHANYIIE